MATRLPSDSRALLVRRIVASVIIVVSVTAMTELAFRYLTPFPGTTATYRQDKDYLYFHKPHSAGWEISPFGEFPPVRLAYNRFGLRNRDFPLAKSPGEIRVLLLGDSYVEARQVPYAQTVAARLEADLTAALGTMVRVMNAGVSAYTTTTEVLLLKHLGLQLDPDIVVVFFAFNDYTDNYWYGRYVDFPQFDVRGLPERLMPNAYAQPGLLSLPEWLRRHSAIFYSIEQRKSLRGLRQNRRRVWAEVAYGSLLTQSPKALLKEGPFTTEENRLIAFTHDGILKMNEMSTRAGIQLLCVIITFPVQVNADEWKLGKVTWGFHEDEVVASTRYQQLLGEFLMYHGIPYVDLLPSFRRAGIQERLFYDFDGHWNAYGHRVVADALCPRLATMLASGKVVACSGSGRP